MVLPSRTDHSREKIAVCLYYHKIAGIIPADCQREKQRGERELRGGDGCGKKTEAKLTAM